MKLSLPPYPLGMRTQNTATLAFPLHHNTLQKFHLALANYKTTSKLPNMPHDDTTHILPLSSDQIKCRKWTEAEEVK